MFVVHLVHMIHAPSVYLGGNTITLAHRQHNLFNILNVKHSLLHSIIPCIFLLRPSVVAIYFFDWAFMFSECPCYNILTLFFFLSSFYRVQTSVKYSKADFKEFFLCLVRTSFSYLCIIISESV